MAPETARQVYESLVSEYSDLCRKHDASVLAAAKSRTRFITADRDEIRALKRTLTANATLIKRSDMYRTHLKYCKVLSRRLLTWNNELRPKADAGKLEEMDLLKYGATCYKFMTAAGALAVMNRKGMKAKVHCEKRYDQVDRIRERKCKANKAGMKAYANQAFETRRMADFFDKLEKFARQVEKKRVEGASAATAATKGGGGGGRGMDVRELRMQLEQWLDAVSTRIQAEMDKAEVEREWDKVCKSDVIREGVDASAAAEEEALYAKFEQMMSYLGSKGHSWCPCCGAGGGDSKKSPNGEEKKKAPKR